MSEERIKKLEDKVDTLTKIILDYLEFWEGGEGLKPIYHDFIERIKAT